MRSSPCSADPGASGAARTLFSASALAVAGRGLALRTPTPEANPTHLRQAARRLADQGVKPEGLDALLREFALAHLKTLGPMPLASFIDGRLKVADSRFLGCQRWAAECAVCEREVGRGELVWLRKGTDQKWLLTCSGCEEIDFASERARSARARALDRDDDPEDLLAAILAHTPEESREAVEDDLATLVAVMAERT